MARNRMARNRMGLSKKMAQGRKAALGRKMTLRKSAGSEEAKSGGAGFQGAVGRNQPVRSSDTRRLVRQRETKIFAQVADESQTLAGVINQEDAWLLLAALSADPESLEEVEAAIGHLRSEEVCQPAMAENGVLGLESLGMQIQTARVDPSGCDLAIDLPGRTVVVSRLWAESCGESVQRPGSAKNRDRIDDGLKMLRSGAVLVDRVGQDRPVRLPYHIDPRWEVTIGRNDWDQTVRQRRALAAQDPIPSFRRILYGSAMRQFLAEELWNLSSSRQEASRDPVEGSNDVDGAVAGPQGKEEAISLIHQKWLLRRREDLGYRSPRQVMTEAIGAVDAMMEDRQIAWSATTRQPASVPRASRAFREALFGSNEWILYYDLVRCLLELGWHWIDGSLQELERDDGKKDPCSSSPSLEAEPKSLEGLARWMEQLQRCWMEDPQPHLLDRSPREVIERERRRLPDAVPVDQQDWFSCDCPMCQWMKEEKAITFWRMDECHMEDAYAFQIDDWSGQEEVESLVLGSIPASHRSNSQWSASKGTVEDDDRGEDLSGSQIFSVTVPLEDIPLKRPGSKGTLGAIVQRLGVETSRSEELLPFPSTEVSWFRELPSGWQLFQVGIQLTHLLDRLDHSSSQGIGKAGQLSQQLSGAWQQLQRASRGDPRSAAIREAILRMQGLLNQDAFKHPDYFVDADRLYRSLQRIAPSQPLSVAR
jgi:hypothetical protein